MLQSLVPEEIVRMLQRQKYHLVGSHSAVKRCRWLYNSIVQDRSCYKQKFYGIKSHQCLQMTPSVFHCTLRCVFCWRAQSGDYDLRWDETRLPEWDDPETIIEGSIREQKRILSGYKANSEADQKKLLEAFTPKHAAISLAGEPTLYPHLGGLIKGFHRRGFTTFLVSNGTVPETLSSLSEEPTQLYISVSAFDKKTFSQVCRPHIPDAWEKLNETLELLPSFRCPTVVRLTLARHVNLKHPEVYAQLIRKANPTYVEPKAYMHVGFSRLRLDGSNMPSHREIREFAAQLANEMSYNTLDESEDSRVVLLSRLEKPIKLA
ncbi:MAG TPA: 4-demethylwyosine synthase TYW1 [Candidatus Bathyarchaeota archaeon]|nr:4-demethylwyosine synthase TYW1 [Candidatus Bathyarchaeota archaeon]